MPQKLLLCNSLLSGCPQYLSNKLQKVQNNTGTKKASSLANIWKMQWSSKCQPIYTPGLSCQKPCVGKQTAPLQQSFQDSRNVSAVICKINEKHLVNCWSFPQQHHPQNNFKISYTTKTEWATCKKHTHPKPWQKQQLYNLPKAVTPSLLLKYFSVTQQPYFSDLRTCKYVTDDTNFMSRILFYMTVSCTLITLWTPCLKLSFSKWWSV